eukprot:gene6989-7545_t
MSELHRELIIINSSHYMNDGCTFRYDLRRNVDFSKPGAHVALYNLAMYNSTYNISSKFGNNQMSITWIDNAVQNITIPDGYYSYIDLSNIIQYYLIQNNWYWIVNNIAVYPITFSSNDPRYASQINITCVPVFASGITKPSGATWSFPLTPTTPTLSMNSSLGKIFGFSSQLTFPPSPRSSNYSFLSDICPIISPVYTYVLTCNLLNTSISTNINNVLSQIPLNNGFGGLVTLNSLLPMPIPIQPGHYSEIVIKFLDQNLNPIQLIDPEITLILVLEY